MDICQKLYNMGEYLAAGMYEEPSRSLFYRKALGLRRYFETCNLHEYICKKIHDSCREFFYRFFL